MNKKINLSIWDREFEMYISFQNYPGEEITDLQEKTEKMIPTADINASLDFVKKYIMKYNADDVDEKGLANIFRCVIPKGILIPRRNDGKRVFAIMCNYKFDMEHGIAIVFENEKYKSIGPQDIIL